MKCKRNFIPVHHSQKQCTKQKLGQKLQIFGLKKSILHYFMLPNVTSQHIAIFFK